MSYLSRAIIGAIGRDAWLYGFIESNSHIKSCADGDTAGCTMTRESIHCELDDMGDCATVEQFVENINNIPQDQVFITP